MNFRTLSVLLLASSSLLIAQAAPGTTKDDEDIVKAGPKDPFTGGDPKAMQAAGVVAYGPLMWADNLRTEDIEKVLGEGRIRWMETPHFLFGFTLSTATPPDEAEPRKLLNADLQRMKKRFAKFPDRASKLEPWLRLHLYAHRAEELYTQFATMFGHDDKSGTFLGQRGKFPILLFQRKSDVARFLDRFCGRKSEVSQRHYYGTTGQNGFVLTAEGDEPRDEATVNAQFRYLLAQSFCDAAGGVPYWLSTGLAHYFERQIPSRMIMAAIKDEESVDQDTQHQWSTKMKKRAQHEKLLIPFQDLAGMTDFGYWGHLQSWSRADYLMSLDRAKLTVFLQGMKGGWGASRQIEALDKAFGLTPEAFDAKWREWVLKTYK